MVSFILIYDRLDFAVKLKEDAIMKLTQENQEYLLGPLVDCYLGYSNDESIRHSSASGGAVTNILYYLIKNGIIDGALVCRQTIAENRIDYEIRIITNPQEILNFSGSVYFDVPILSAVDQIRDFNGRLAIVGLPCHIRAISGMCKRDEELSKKIALKIGLFCGHNSRRELLLDVLRKKKISESDIDKVIFRRGHWRGKTHVYLKSGEKLVFPFQHFSIYQNLHFDSLRKCIYCTDHTAEHSDISCGDAWLTYLKKDPIKHSIILTRNDTGDKCMKELRREGELYLMKIEPEIVYKSQKRSLIYHKSIEARSKVGRRLGINLSYSVKYKNTARWNDYIAALIALLNIKLSYNARLRRLIFLTPRWLLYPYLFLFKILTNF